MSDSRGHLAQLHGQRNTKAHNWLKGRGRVLGLTGLVRARLPRPEATNLNHRRAKNWAHGSCAHAQHAHWQSRVLQLSLLACLYLAFLVRAEICCLKIAQRPERLLQNVGEVRRSNG